MTRLLVAELKRVLWRRVTWGTVAGLAVLGLGVTLLFVSAMATEESVAGTTQLPSVEDVTDLLKGGAVAAAVVLSIACFLLAASLMGAESTSGGLSQWLTFCPNRHKVYTSKLTAAVVAAVIIGLAGLLGYLLVFEVFGVLNTWPQPSTGPIVAVLGRALVAVALAAAVGHALAALFGHTAAAPIALGIYLVLVIVRGFFGMLSEGMQRFSLEMQAYAFLNGGISYPVFTQGYDLPPTTVTISTLEGALTLVGLTALITAVSWWWFARRDHA